MKQLILTVALCCAAPVLSADDSPVTGPVQDDLLAAETLRCSAVALVNASPDTPARATRLVCVVRMAERLEPGHPQTHRLLSDI